MKVQGLSDLIRSMQRVNGNAAYHGDREGRDGSHGGSGHSKDQHQHGDQSHPQQDEFRKLLELRQKIDLEIERFAQDEVARTSGLHARREGEGPGLRVFLQDAGGSVIRRMSGEEFLRIRSHATGPGAVGRGKLLDKKL
jgi:hypothetical protein